MKIFKHPNLENFKCPICGTNEDKEIVLVPILGTERKNIAEAEQIHVDCINLYLLKAMNMDEHDVLFQRFIIKN